MAALTTEAQFSGYVSDLLSSEAAIDHSWSEDRLKIIFPKRNEQGFDIEVRYDPTAKTLEVETDRGYHDHFHVEKFDTFGAALGCVFGLVRDLLSRNMRIEETLSNGRPRKWQLQSYKDGNWVTEASVGLLVWNVFAKKTSVTYSNDVLPPREFDQDA